MSKYGKNGRFVTPVKDEESDETQEIHLRDQILEQISDEEPQVEDEEVEEGIETQLARLRKEDSKDGEDMGKMDISKNKNVIGIEQDSSESFHVFEVQVEEHAEEDDEGENTTAVLEAVALAEQDVTTPDGTELVTINRELDLEEQLNSEVTKGPQKMKKLKPRVIKEEYLEPVVTRFADQYTCQFCDAEKQFLGDLRAIVLHVKQVHNLRIYICDMCGENFRKRNELRMHLDEHVATEKGDFQCEVCNRIFQNLRLFRVHKQIHYPQSKLWICETCGKRYRSKNLLGEHINTHTGVRPYICDQCGKNFASKYNYKAHEKTHQVHPKSFQCSHCSKSFLNQRNLTQHEIIHSGVKKYVCGSCGIGFESLQNLEMHSTAHIKYKPYACEICGKTFARKSEIHDHERTHTGERPYQCEFCGATFCQRSNLQSHKRAIHDDDKRFKCEACEKSFNRRRLLDYHIMSAHTGERPFKCGVCEATFVYPEYVKKHRRIHTGEKPFLCEVCGKAFNNRDNRNAHRFVHSDKKLYECLVCGKGFMRKAVLHAHMQKQGHVNDTIVVNQPRLDDPILTINADGKMETVNHEVGDLEHMEAEGKDGEHVILQDGDVCGDRNEMVGEHLDDGVSEGLEDAIKHLIIDGQLVEFAEQVADEAEEHQIITTQAILNENGQYEAEVTDALVDGDSQTIQFASGHAKPPIIKIPSADGEQEENAWTKIVSE